MSLKSLRNIWDTLTFRIVFWYAAVFTISSILAFYIYFIMVSAVISRQTDKELVEEVEEFADIYNEHGIEGIINKVNAEGAQENPEEESFRLLDNNGETIVSTDLSAWGDFAPSNDALKKINEGAEHIIQALSIPGRGDKVKIIYGRIGLDYIFQFGESLDEEAAFLNVFKGIFL